jgi:hypothetical protein
LLVCIRRRVRTKSDLFDPYKGQVHRRIIKHRQHRPYDATVPNVDFIDRTCMKPVSSVGLGIRFGNRLGCGRISFIRQTVPLSPPLQMMPSCRHTGRGKLDPASVPASLHIVADAPQYSSVPDPARARIRKPWDPPLVSRKREKVLSPAQTQVGCTCLIAVTATNSGDLLQARHSILSRRHAV